MQAGAGIADIGALLGHKSLQTTTKYTHINMGYLKRQMAFHPRAETSSASQTINPRAATVRPTKRKETPVRQINWGRVAWDKAAKRMLSLANGAVAAFERETKDKPRERLLRFEHDRHATLSGNSDPTYALFDLITEPPTLRFFAGHSSPEESAELLGLAARYDDLTARLLALKAEQNALVARIQFAGASPGEVKEVRREGKGMRVKLAA